ncbi:DNA glycosylase [Daldinia caldariorum]|uniref:DNA glycosylase n=1 Tax=Daldinia caldariorum TaxID=326644 RepID=UPI002007B297|nr:DNA glycosylase [Daldinia caldariorum]KAI1466595.1 DNA glycosylase [Daldinia caldariorum]
MPRRGHKARAAPIKGGWNLPHGMGVSLIAKSQEAQSPIPTPPIAESPHSTESYPVGESSSSLDSTPTTVAPTPETVTSESAQNSLSTARSTELSIVKKETTPQSTRRKIIIKIKVPKQIDVDEVLQSNKKLALEPKEVDEEYNVKSIDAVAVQYTGRQLRPRKPKPVPEVSNVKEDNHDSAVLDQIPYEQIDKGLSKKRKRESKTNLAAADEGINADILLPEPKKTRTRAAKTNEGNSQSIAKKTKDNRYGLMPQGESPFPEWLAPSNEQCEEVHRLLTEMHGEVNAPQVISAPSLEVMGCGEVPSVLDGLLRTLLSGATRIEHIDMTLIPLAEKYGVSNEGVGKESINWDNVRLGTYQELVDALYSGGLANIKAKHIKAILDTVYQENVERREAHCQTKSDTLEERETNEQKGAKVRETDSDELSLEHLRGLSKHEILKALTKYPGIGVKTAACVILFCFQMPCIAVDTHVYRFSKWLGWVPKNASITDVFSHLEVHCPDHLKYGLHQLFIRHGQRCGKCSSSTAEGTADWDLLPECPLESLLDRYDKKQSKAKSKLAKESKSKDEEEDKKGE